MTKLTRLQRLRIFLGVPTRADKAAAHAEMIQNIQDALNEEDQRDVYPDEMTPLSEVTQRERPSKR